MDDGGPTASIILFLALLLIDMFFYGFGAAIHLLNTKEIQKKVEEKDKKSIRLNGIIENPGKYVNTVQLIVTMTTIVMGGFYLGIWLRYIHKILAGRIDSLLNVQAVSIISLVLSAAVLIYVILTFGVLLPKKLASRFPDKWAYFCINPIYYVTKVLSPLTGLVDITTNGLLRIFGLRPGEGINDVTEEEIISMVNEGHEQGLLQASEAEMITNIFELGDKQARDIMTNRKNISAIEAGTLLKDAIQFMLNERNSRYPVYEENIDHIVGILHLKDAVKIHAMDEQYNAYIRDIPGLIREAEFIPETRNIDALFRTMQSNKTQMVIVIDEYGQTSGLVAMEDILEEIVGNILDEYDEDERYIEEKGENQYEIEGLTPLDELEERFAISFQEEEFETLNGFLISKMDKIPEEDEEFDIDVDGYNFKVLSVKNKMIQTVLVTKKKEEREEDVRTFEVCEH